MSPAVLKRLKKALANRIPDRMDVGCFVCRWILEDLEKNGVPTDYPRDAMGAGIFPWQGKMRHLELEGLVFKIC